jgi:hypothetical protein
VVIGQSNAVGRGQALNFYAYAGDVGGLFKKPGTAWLNLTDPTDDNPLAKGSVWPLVANSYLAARSAPVGIIPAAVDSSSIAQWLPGTANYNAMLARVTASGEPVKGVLWWQGESDAIAGLSQALYHSRLATIAAQIQADLGAPLFVAKLQNCTGVPAANLAAINAAIQASWSDIPNVRPGPDLSDIVTDDNVHLIAQSSIEMAAARWWTAIRTEFGW